ncbi:MAG: glycosyltransferase family 39 protein [Chloroflexi bacterium]|nr:glycosyltransferase family 39 protein [Chloroflexota bacterium]
MNTSGKQSVNQGIIPPVSNIVLAPSLGHAGDVMTHPSSTTYQPRAATAEYEGLRVFVGLMPAVLLLLGFFFVRAHFIDGPMPYFVDEIRHIERGRIVWSFSDMQTSTTPGKFLLYYWIGLFDLPAHLPGWLARTPVALFTMLGAAGTFALARLMFSRQTALLALAILGIFPFMVFYERLALSDSMTASLVVLMVWWSLVTLRRPTAKNGLILGVLLTLMLAAKILAAPLVAMPVLAVILLSKQGFTSRFNLRQQAIEAWRAYHKPLLCAFILTGLIWALILGFYKYRQITDPAGTSPIVDRYLYEGARSNLHMAQQLSISGRLISNIRRTGEVIFYLWGPLLAVLTLISLPILWRKHQREMVYLLAGIVLLWGTVIFSAGRLTTRYMMPVGHLWVILIAAGVLALQSEMIRREGRWRTFSWTPLAILLIWAITFGGPFYNRLVENPAQLALPERDTYEYFQNQTGYAVRDVLQDVAQMPMISSNTDVPIIFGMVRTCSFLGSHISADVYNSLRIVCSPEYTTWPGRDWPDNVMRYTYLNSLLAEHGPIYLMVEEFPDEKDNQFLKIDPRILQGRMEWVATYHRPHNGVQVSLYIVYPQGQLMSNLRPSPEN